MKYKMDFLKIIMQAISEDKIENSLFRAFKKAENDYFEREEFFEKLKDEANKLDNPLNTTIDKQSIILLKKAIAKAECMVEPEFNLGFIYIPFWEEIEKDVHSIESKENKINFIDNLINQTNIDKALELWKKDCKKCVIQFEIRPGWQGVFDRHLGKVEPNRAIKKEAYLGGVEHYEYFLKLKELRKKIENGRDNNRLSLHCTLNDMQIELLTDCANKIGMFKNKIDFETMKAIFNCTLSEPLQLNNNTIAACFFNLLSPQFICNEWQSIIEKNELLIGKRFAPMTAINLSKSLNNQNTQSEYYKIIVKTIKNIK